ncbi:MAG: adenylate/guanylate cyclase domain-containing protein [Pseudomonadota bacterium]
MQCKKCESHNPTEYKFCAQCGEQLEIKCLSCNFYNQANNKFCGGCGCKLREQTKNYKSPIKTETKSYEGERRQATIAFSDLSGYTKMSEQLDPEDIQQMMSKIKSAAIRIIESQGGIVNQFIGDEVVILFGIPICREDDPIRAIRAILILHEFVKNLSFKWQKQFDIPLSMHTGINTGLIVTHIEDNRDGRFGLTGDTVNTGARLLSQAENNEILVSPDTHHLIKNHFETIALPAVSMKGKTKPIIPYKILREQHTIVKNHKLLIGREAEVKKFKCLLELSVSKNMGAAILIKANAGLGKSRIIEEFCKISKQYGISCNKGLILDFGIEKNQNAIQSVLKQLLFQSIDNIEGKNIDKIINMKLLSIENRCFLYDMLGVKLPKELAILYNAMDNETRIQGTHETLCELIINKSKVSPLTLVIEDAHWADPTLIEYIKVLSKKIINSAIILIVSTRKDGDKLSQFWKKNDSNFHTIIELFPLKKDEAILMASDCYELTNKIAIKCIERAEGNPLFLEQLLLSAQESEDEQIPSSIQSLIQARIDRLDPINKIALQAASIIGQKFNMDLLNYLTNKPGYQCTTLLKHQLIKAEGNSYLFTHALIQQGVYNSMLKAKRRVFHSQVGKWFIDKDIERCAENFDRANDEHAARYYYESAKIRISKSHYQQAIKLIHRGLELVGDVSLKTTLSCLQGQTLLEIGDTTEAIAIYQNIIEFSNDVSARVESMLGLVVAFEVIGEYEKALELLEQSEKLIINHSLTPEQAKLHHLRGNLYFSLGQVDNVVNCHEQSLKYARISKLTELECNALGGMGDAYYMKGMMKTANQYFKSCIELSAKHGYHRIEVANLSMYAYTLWYLNEFDKVIDVAKKAAKMAESINYHRPNIINSGILCEAYLENKEYDLAEQECHKQFILEKNINTQFRDGLIYAKLGQIEFRRGNKSKALSYLKQAVASCHQNGMSFSGPAVYGIFAEITDNYSEKQEYLKQAELLLNGDCVSHNYFYFYRSAMEVELQNKNWIMAKKYADSLQSYTQKEPLPQSDFIIKRARTLALLGQGMIDKSTYSSLDELRIQAKKIGFNFELVRLDEAMNDFILPLMAANSKFKHEAN